MRRRARAHAAQFLQQRQQCFVALVLRLESLADQPQVLADGFQRGHQVLHACLQAVAPHRLLVQGGRDADGGLLAVLEPGRDAIKKLRRISACILHRRAKTRAQQIEAGNAEQVAARHQARLERRQQALRLTTATSLQPIEKLGHRAVRHAAAQVIGGGVFQVMALVHHQMRVGGQHGRLGPVLRRATHGDVGQQQRVVHHHHIRRRGMSTCLEHEAGIEVAALETCAQITFGRNLVPHIRARRRGEVAERAVVRRLRPFAEHRELLALRRLEQRRTRGLRLRQPREAEIVAPALQQCKADRLVAEQVRQQRQVLADELFLQRDRVGADDRPFLVRSRPSQRGHEIRHRLADAGARFQQRNAAVRIRARDRGRHVTLTVTRFIRDEAAGKRTISTEVAFDGRRGHHDLRRHARHLHHDIQVGDIVVDDAESDAVVVHPGCDRQVGVAGLQPSRGMIVHEHLATLCHAGQRQHLA